MKSVFFTCLTSPSNIIIQSYQWNTTGCYTNDGHNDGNPKCFPHGQITQSVIGHDLTADDAGTITCSITIDNVKYTSDPLTLLISGRALVLNNAPLIMTKNVIYYEFNMDIHKCMHI